MCFLFYPDYNKPINRQHNQFISFLFVILLLYHYVFSFSTNDIYVNNFINIIIIKLENKREHAFH